MTTHIIDRVTIAEIHRVATECVALGSTIVSDDHTSYKRLKDLGYKHVSQNYNKSDPEEFLKWLHIVSGNAKAFIEGTYHGLASKYLQSYLDEFCYRFNRRQFPNELFAADCSMHAFCRTDESVLSRCITVYV